MYALLQIAIPILSACSAPTGLVLFHPLLPFPSSNNSAVYLDISTLEPHTGFQEIRDAMIK